MYLEADLQVAGGPFTLLRLKYEVEMLNAGLHGAYRTRPSLLWCVEGCEHMASNSAQVRGSSPISPLLVVGVIFAAVATIELLLMARFWLLLASVDASSGIQAFVIDVTRPLVSPFSDAGQSVEKSVGTFERRTLLAGMAYLLGGAGLAVIAMTVGGLLSGRDALTTKQRRHTLASFGAPGAFTPAGTHLLTSASLRLTPSQARRALNMLHLERFNADFVVIPAEGGCIVAAFTGPGAQNRWPVFGRFASRRDTRLLNAALRAIQSRFELVRERAHTVAG